MMTASLAVMGPATCLRAQSRLGYDTLSYIPDHYAERMRQFQAQPVHKGAILFLGNSITEMGHWRELLGDTTVINRGISGDITFGVLHRLDEIFRMDPSRIFLEIGINDISKDIPDKIIEANILKIAGSLHAHLPHSKIYVQSLLPTNNTFPAFPQWKNKDQHIRAVNRVLKRAAHKDHYTYVDLYDQFLDTHHRLDARYTLEGLHLNPSGYIHWVNYLKKMQDL